MPEAAVVKKVMQALKGWDPLRVENIHMPGTPDINFIGGWIEVKWVLQYPVKDETIITCRHFTIEQRNFLKRRMLMGGATFLFVGIAGNYYLFDGIAGANFFGFVERQMLRRKARNVWWRRFPKSKELMKALSDITGGA